MTDKARKILRSSCNNLIENLQIARAYGELTPEEEEGTRKLEYRTDRFFEKYLLEEGE